MDKSMIDAAIGGALMDKTLAVERNLIFNMVGNTQQFDVMGSTASRLVNEIGPRAVLISEIWFYAKHTSKPTKIPTTSSQISSTALQTTTTTNTEDEPSSKGSTLFFGRPFLMTTNTKIDVHAGTLSMEFGDNMCTCDGGKECSICADICVAIDARPEVIKVVEVAKIAASEPPSPSIMQPPTSEFKPLPKHLKYVYLEDDPKLLVIPKKSMIIVVKNQNDELVLTRIQISWQINIRPLSPARSTHLPTLGCRSAFAMPQAPPKESCMKVFVDDFTVYGHSFDACLESLSRVLDRCIETNVVLNFEKCHFMVTEGLVLGHLVSNRGIEVDKAKIDIIASLSHPTFVWEVRSFLGHAGFYKRFTQNFNKMALPLSKLLQQDIEFVFDQLCIKAFQELKKRLTTTPIL
ncbi:Retrovirus-related Pol polyprotein from transposon 17.6, partial [Mucuna pruriens]